MRDSLSVSQLISIHFVQDIKVTFSRHAGSKDSNPYYIGSFEFEDIGYEVSSNDFFKCEKGLVELISLLKKSK